MKAVILSGILFFFLLGAQAQTTVPSSLFSNTHWTTAGSPYIVSVKVVLFNSDTLVIDPGVTVKFDSGACLEIRGFMYAHGRPGDTIEFTSNRQHPQMNDWVGIVAKTPTGDLSPLRQISMSYCKASYASFFMDLRETNNGPYLFSNCYFALNDFVSSTTAAGVSPVQFDSCMFYGNNLGLGGGNITANHCSFVNGKNGVTGISRTYACYFEGNSEVAVATYGSTEGCTIINNHIGYQNYFNAGNNTFINNYVVDNDTGIYISFQYFNGSENVTGNTICNRSLNIITTSSNPADLSQNCWCTTDSVAIRAKIYDGYVDNSYGLVSYIPYGVNCAYALGSETLEKEELVALYPNPFGDHITIAAVRNNQVAFTLYDASGRLLMAENINVAKTLDVFYLGAGFYTYRVRAGENLSQGTIVKY